MPRKSDTPGAWILKKTREGEVFWIGRWVDPITKKRHDLRFDTHGITNAQERRAWARRKSEEVQATRKAVQLGRVAGRTEVKDAVEAYLNDCRGRGLRAVTVRRYREPLESLRDWLGARGRRVVQELTRHDLMAYRQGVMQQPFKPRTKSNHLETVFTALVWWQKNLLTPLLTREDLEHACERLPRDPTVIRCLRPDDIRAILQAAVERLEPDGIAFVVLALLTGMRVGELMGLAWAEVDLGALPGGVVRVAQGVETHAAPKATGARTKTRIARVVDLSVAPLAKAVLDAFPRRGPWVFRGDKPVSRRAEGEWKAALQVLSAPWTWQNMRQTCGSYLACSPGIWGSAGVYRTARQLGHSVAIAERSYYGVLRAVPASATVLEDAMEARAEFDSALSALNARTSKGE